MFFVSTPMRITTKKNISIRIYAFQPHLYIASLCINTNLQKCDQHAAQASPDRHMQEQKELITPTHTLEVLDYQYKFLSK
jgi:hypothetical protein